MITILTSGIGLGVYIPALLIQRQLTRLAVDSDVEVLEDYYTPEALGRLDAHEIACRDNFELALMGHRMTRDVGPCLDRVRIDALLSRWAEQGRTEFIVWSGFWLPLIEQYRGRSGRPLQVQLCRIDAEVSASFRLHRALERDAAEIWLWNWEQRRVEHMIPVTDDAPVAFGARKHRLVIHGGGWGIGTYAQRIDDLARTSFAIDRVVHDGAPGAHIRSGDRCFRIDPEWRPWHRPGGIHAFPPMSELPANDLCHPLYDVIRHATAIVSKPGGGTLVDSLASATPVVFLEAYGYAEERNAAIWEHLGGGISWHAWRESGFDPGVLARLHDNLLSIRANAVDYPRAYARRLAA